MDNYIETLKRRRSIALVIFLFSGFLTSAAEVLLHDNETWFEAAGIVGMLVGILAISAWCRFDAGIQGYPLSIGLRLLILLLAVIGVPRYLTRARGWQGALRVGFGLPAILAMLAMSYAGWYLTYWIAGWMGYSR